MANGTLSLDPIVQPLLLETLLAVRATGRPELFGWVADRLRDDVGRARLLTAETIDDGIIVRLKPWVELALLRIRDVASDSRLTDAERTDEIREALASAGL
jgi:hypothetical protein